MKAKQILATIIASTMLTCCAMQSKAIKNVDDKHIVATNLTGIVYNLSREEGLQQLRRLTIDNKYEDIWFFIPETKEWIDYGKGIKVCGADVDMDLLPTLRPDVKEVSSYHLHTLKCLSMMGFDKSELLNFQGATPPSFYDIQYWLEDKDNLNKSGIKLTEAGVVDLGGYWQVDLESSDLDKIRYSLSKYERLMDGHITKYYFLYKENKNDKKTFEIEKKKRIKEFEQEAAKLGLKLKYNFL